MSPSNEPDINYVYIRYAQVGTGSVSVAEEVAEVQKLLKASGLVYTMHSAGTTVGTSLPLPLFHHLTFPVKKRKQKKMKERKKEQSLPPTDVVPTH